MSFKEFIEALVCPKCKGDLEYIEEPKSLLCKRCGRVYKIEGIIPIFVTDDGSARGKDNRNC